MMLIFFSFCYFFFSLFIVVNMFIKLKEWGELVYTKGLQTYQHCQSPFLSKLLRTI